MNIETISESQSHSHSHISPEVLLSCSIIYALAVSLSYSFYALMLASLIPVLILAAGRINLSSLMKLNVFNLIMIITLALTWPTLKSGIMKGIIIAMRVNIIYIFFSSMIYPLGYAKIFGAMNALKVPEKLRVLLLLTVRGIFIMHEKFSSALISLRLRAPNLHGLMKFRSFAYITASVLLQSSERSDRMMRAIECRGGFSGFIQTENDGMRMNDVIICMGFMIYVLMIIILNYA
ncbi:MAG: hypothetical protein IJS42_02225 [Synergistaceae bacterium]|nr:hypothetical protein [Synergistaceae bacterium]